MKVKSKEVFSLKRELERYQEIEKSIITTYRKTIWERFIEAINEYKLIDE